MIWPLVMSRLSQARAPRAGAGTLASSPTWVMAGAPATAAAGAGAGALSCALTNAEATASVSAAATEETEKRNLREEDFIGIDRFGPLRRAARRRARARDEGMSCPLWQGETHGASARRLCCTSRRKSIRRP